MFKKTITYEDLDGNPVTEDFYFHMSKAELLEMATDGDVFEKRIKRLVETKDNRAIFNEFRELVGGAVGIRSEDGRRFDKSPEAKARLMNSPAFDELILELCTSADAGASFVKQLLPDKMQKELTDRLKIADNTKTEDGRDLFASDNEDPRPAWVREDRDPTERELREMSTEQLAEAMKARLARKKQS